MRHMPLTTVICFCLLTANSVWAQDTVKSADFFQSFGVDPSAAQLTTQKLADGMYVIYVVHMGDVYNSRYPFIDADNGGDMNGTISFSENILELINIDTIVIPGHGQVSTYQDLKNYISMLKIIRDRIVLLIGEGATLEDVFAANPTAEWDEVKGDRIRLIDRAYKSLSR
ncbi:MAG: hypothetical protein ACI9H8_002579 [Lysobacterales bacterium]|jgi:hypothetical protein